MSLFPLPKMLVSAAMLLTLGGCVTMSGDYNVTAVDANGQPIKMVMTSHGSAIYSSRNAFCSNFPKATVTIRDFHTGEELKSESPYHCR
ncbi:MULTISPECIES: hypothetical protein [unclassified Pseudomonas]|uniref:hypothetical protein n=1 Tax=unclassified Pseudomonas TaxID=196821 RepID=UPI00211614F3|nr:MULTISPECIES: hypothetical protein [unclassified Pseudomonas]MCS4250104.1 hypothetical protein [Pseudomonas sp. BIGb0164]